MTAAAVAAQAALAPETIAGHAAGHGMHAALAPDGATVVTCTKAVEEGARAMILLIPTVVRIDVRPQDDAVQVLVRKLAHRDLAFGNDIRGQPGWRASDTEAPPRSDGPQRMEFQVFAQMPEFAILSQVLLFFNPEPFVRATHLSVRARIREIDPASVTLV